MAQLPLITAERSALQALGFGQRCLAVGGYAEESVFALGENAQLICCLRPFTVAHQWGALPLSFPVADRFLQQMRPLGGKSVAVCGDVDRLLPFYRAGVFDLVLLEPFPPGILTEALVDTITDLLRPRGCCALLPGDAGTGLGRHLRGCWGDPAGSVGRLLWWHKPETYAQRLRRRMAEMLPRSMRAQARRFLAGQVR